MTASSLQSLLRQKNVVFITVKNKEYIRVTQIERLLKQEALSYIVYSSEKNNPLTRAIDINRRIKKTDFGSTDVVILGFLPQLVWKTVNKKITSSRVKIKDGNKSEVPIIADFFLSLYDTICLDRKLVSSKGLVAWLLRKLDRRVLAGAELVITDTKADADFFASEYDINRDKFEVLYLEADNSIFSEGKAHGHYAGQSDDAHGETSVKSAEHDENLKEVLYFGTGLPLQGTDIVLKAFDEISSDEQIKCTYIGGTKGITKELLGRLSANPNVELIDWLSQEELSKRIEAASLCIAGHFNAKIDKADRTIPGKAYIYEAMNKAMILGDTRANHELFTEDERHIFVKRGDSSALAGAIRKSLK